MYTDNGNQLQNLYKSHANNQFSYEMHLPRHSNLRLYNDPAFNTVNNVNTFEKLRKKKDEMEKKYTKEYVSKLKEELQKLIDASKNAETYRDFEELNKKRTKIYKKWEEYNRENSNLKFLKELHSKFYEKHGGDVISMESYRRHRNIKKFLNDFEKNEKNKRGVNLLLLYDRLQFQRNMYKKMQNNAAIKAYSSKFRS